MNREEMRSILKKHDDVLEAMAECAKQVAIEFVGWANRNYHRKDDGLWFEKFPIPISKPREYFNDEQLYSLWEQTKK